MLQQKSCNQQQKINVPVLQILIVIAGTAAEDRPEEMSALLTGKVAENKKLLK